MVKDEQGKKLVTKRDYDGKWDIETNVIVLGGGMAGCCAAIELDILGEKDCILLEKAPEKHVGGGARVSGQSVTTVSEDYKALMEYQRNMNKPNIVPEDILETWAKAMTTQRQWMIDRADEAGYVYNWGGVGVTSAGSVIEHPEISGVQAVLGTGECRLPEELPYKPPRNQQEIIPARTWEAFWMNVKKRGIKVMFETPAVELIQDLETDEVLGVVAEQQGKRILIKARKAVILCTGGFSANIQMLRDFYGIGDVHNMSSPYNTGDGQKMLMKIGADMWHMRNPTTTGGVWIGVEAPGYMPFFRNLRMPRWSWIEVAKDATRFYNEAYHWSLRHMHMEYHGGMIDSPHFQCLPVHLIFDEATRLSGPIVISWMGWQAVMGDYQWSSDNSKEIEAGWITRAESIGDLAMKLGLDQKRLRETVTKYNKLAEAGEVDEFDREPEMMEPIKQPPYYGVELFPSIVTTTGGGRRDKEARVINVDGETIPRIYEVGECGSTLGNLYQNGSFLTECVVFGRIAAKNALNEQPWS